MVRIAAVALLAFSVLVSAAPLARRQITHDQIVPLLTSRGLADSDVIPQLTARQLKAIIAQVKRQDDCAAAEAPAEEATPAPATGGGSADGSSIDFPELAYKDFQISSGQAGDGLNKVNKIIAVFQGVDLSTVSDAAEDNLSAMRSAAETAETDNFNPLIDAATGDRADQLQNGKILNKVLKLRLFQQLLEIKVRSVSLSCTCK